MSTLQSTPPVVVVAVFAFAGLVFLGVGVREAVRAARIRTRSVAPVAALSPGADGTVVGRAKRASATTTAPFSGRDCLACRWRVAERRPASGLDGSRRVAETDLEVGQVGSRFRVEDEHGSVTVDPETADLRLATAWVSDGGASLDGAPTDSLDGPTDVRYYEARIHEGDTLAVRGRLAPDESDGAAELRADRVASVPSGDGTSVTTWLGETSAREALLRAGLAVVAGLLSFGLMAVLTALANV